MGKWVPESDTWWIVPIVALVFASVGFALGYRLTARLSADIMEHCHLQTLKDTVKSIWTNLAVTSALLLTIVFSMLQADKMEPMFFVDEDMADDLDNIQHMYTCFILLALMWCLVALFECIINLTYVEPLNNLDTIKYVIANPNSLGEPTVWTILAGLAMLLATAMYVLGEFGLPCALIGALVVIAIVAFIGVHLRDKSMFDPTGKTPKAEEWQYTMKDPSEWPLFAAKDEKSIKIFQRFGQAILDADKQTEAEQPASSTAKRMCI